MKDSEPEMRRILRVSERDNGMMVASWDQWPDYHMHVPGMRFDLFVCRERWVGLAEDAVDNWLRHCRGCWCRRGLCLRC